MLERHHNKHAVVTNQNEDIILHALISLKVGENIENYSVTKGNAVIAKNKFKENGCLFLLDENKLETDMA